MKPPELAASFVAKSPAVQHIQSMSRFGNKPRMQTSNLTSDGISGGDERCSPTSNLRALGFHSRTFKCAVFNHTEKLVVDAKRVDRVDCGTSDTLYETP